MNEIVVRPAILGHVNLPRIVLRCRGSVLACEPRYRILRIARACALHGLHHARLSGLLRGQWSIIRSHSSWSRA